MRSIILKRKAKCVYLILFLTLYQLLAFSRHAFAILLIAFL